MRFRFIAVFSIVAVSTARAQIRETAAAFDSATRILSVSPGLVTRLSLAAPAWPVAGDFREARLFRTSDSAYVLVVTRKEGVFDRYAMTDAQYLALQTQVNASVAREGRVVADESAVAIAEPVRGPFVRDQMWLSALLYGPALAALAPDGPSAGGAYLASVGGTFFVVNEFARQRLITRAQNSLTTDGAIRGDIAVALASTAAHLDLGGNRGALAALAGGIGGAMIGYNRGARFTSSEAAATTATSTLAAAATLGLASTVGFVREQKHDDRRAAGAALAGGIVGYLVGPEYPRLAHYSVTAGDVRMVKLGAYLGGMAAVSPALQQQNTNLRVVSGLATAGLVGGALIADHIAARPFNYTDAEARNITLGAWAGALVGLAIPVSAQSESAALTASAVTGGAILGAFVAHGMTSPVREGSTVNNSTSPSSGVKVDFHPEGLGLTAAKVQGQHAVLSIRF